MSGKLAKNIRRAVKKHDLAIAMEFKSWVNSLGIGDRIQLAIKVLKGKM